jgi:hypothetical protein
VVFGNNDGEQFNQQIKARDSVVGIATTLQERYFSFSFSSYSDLLYLITVGMEGYFYT